MRDSDPANQSQRLAEHWKSNDLTGGGEMPSTPARGIVSFFSQNRQEGRWGLPRYLRVLSVFASVTVDLRDAVIQDGESIIEAVAVLGEVKIIAPPNIIVECDGDAFMGEFAIKRSRRDDASLPSPDPGAPVVRIRGSAYLAGITIRVKGTRKAPFGRSSRIEGPPSRG